MSRPSITESLDRWQTGALFILGSVIVGLLAGSIVGQSIPLGGVAGLIAFVAGALLFFVTASYLLYGR